jgi:membrane protein YdbS with pleckstrin-like domain
MMCVLAMMVLAQVSAGVIALATGLDTTSASWPGSIVALTVFFTALWLLSAWLFRKAAREQTIAAGQGRTAE